MVLDDADRARLGARLAPGWTDELGEALLQPCPALSGRLCSVYPDRPARCRRFRCELLKRVEDDRLPIEEAQATIVEAKRLADRLRDQSAPGATIRAARRDALGPGATPAQRLAGMALEAFLDRSFRAPRKRRLSVAPLD